MNVTEVLLEALRARGATEVFGIPGDFALPFFNILHSSGVLPCYTLSHEPAVGFAADAAARYRGGLGVAAVTYGAGALNLVNAVAGAYAEKSPLVVISGAPGTREGQSGLLLHHQAKSLSSQHRIFQEVTCDQAVLDDPAAAPALLARVLHNCVEQSRPVYLELPRDVAGAAAAPAAEAYGLPVDEAAVAACAREVMERLERADRPVMLVGVEIRRYGLEGKVAQLARHLGIPVATTFMGRGLLADADCPLIGSYLGLAGDPAIGEIVEAADALLLLGVILCDTNFGVSARQIDARAAIEASDRHVHLGYHTYSDIPLERLIDALLQRAAQRCADVAPYRHSYPCGLAADDAAITPDDISCAVNDLFTRHEPLPMAADTGDCLFAAMEIAHTELVAPGYYAGMGFAVPAGLGIQAATGRRPLILVGDGAFQMTGWELGNCARYGWDPIVIVFNNRGWGMLSAFQPQAPYNDLGEWPLAALAEHLGGHGERVGTRAELARALERAIRTRGRFQMIEVMIAPGSYSRNLTRFVAAMSRFTGGI